MQNIKICFNDFKIFYREGKAYVFDVENGRIIQVDERTLKVIKNSGLTKELLFEKCKVDFSKEEFEKLLETMEKANFMSYDESNKNETQEYKKEEIVGITLMLIQGCNLACSYCFGNEGSYCDSGIMDIKVALKAIDYLTEHTKTEEVLVTFFGGEPLLAIDLIKRIIEYCETKEKKFKYSMTTNGTLLNDEINDLIVKNKISTIVSIDGDKEKNNKNRFYKNGKGSYDTTVSKSRFLRENYTITSRATLTYGNLDMISTFEHLDGLGFRNVPMAPANNLISDLEYVDYINNEIKLIDYVAELIHRGEYKKVKKITFVYSGLISIHYGVNRDFGCGAGIRDVAIDIHGDIYPCHRFVSHKETCIGNIFDKYESNEMEREKYLDMVKIENLGKKPKCSKCWVRKYCGGGCVSENYEETRDMLEQSPRECFHKQVFYEKLIELYIGLKNDEKKELFGE